MTDRDTGGPAFAPNGAPDPSDTTKALYGMTLRDWFAGQVVAAMVAKLDGSLSYEEQHYVAKEAFSMADAMLAERSK